MMDALLGLAACPAVRRRVSCGQILALVVIGYVFRVDRGKGGDSC